ncbi:hypothetical protein ACIBG7_04625 [Nonomuraea sp. NPDC050328]|uniref:hypothetical protein n=1 Tax=Nonomuraea sp. NPDC050328 TaxID=3364361 RepID=UPI0037928D71
MGAVVRVALGVVAGATFATGAAAAAESRVTIYPPNARAGGQVSIYVSECGAATGGVTASSMAFEGRHVRLARSSQGGWTGRVEIDDRARATAHEVVVRCADGLVKAYLSVDGRGRPYPRVGPDTGGGGLAVRAEPWERAEEPGGAGRALWLAGAVGVLALTAGAGVVAVRRRRGSGQ